MRVVLLLALITVSEATIGVFVKLTGDAIPIQTLNFYALSFGAAFLAMACASSDNLGHQSVLSFGGSGSSLIEFMRFQFGGASAA